MDQKDGSMTLEEAMDNLAIASAIEDPYRVGIFGNKRLLLQGEEDSEQMQGFWLTKGSAEDLIEIMRKTFVRITLYLKSLYKSDSIDWNQPKTRKGLQSMMVLVGESANKVDKAIIKVEGKDKKRPKIAKLSEYKILQEFYIDNITEKFTVAPPQGDEAWEEDQDEDTPVKDFESIRRDSEYELFYLKNTDNKPFFKRSLIKNMRLMFDFTEQIDVPLEDDPLLHIVTIKDRDLQGSAAQILRSIHTLVQEFYDLKIRLKKSDLIISLNHAIFSLMLAANEQNLIHHTVNKNCLKYFLDFQLFLKQALVSDDYQKWMSYTPGKSDKVARFLLRFTHKLAYEFFMRSSSIRQEALGYIHRLIRKGKEVGATSTKTSSFWEKLLQEHEQIKTLLDKYPSGPLFKMLDTMQGEEGKKTAVFEPIQQENTPFLLFSMQIPDKTVYLLHLPTPTKQSTLAKAEVAEEFRAFLAYLHEDTSEQKKHLLINLQDRTSWKENVRASALENLQNRAEYSENITVITLPKDTAFYHQIEDYEEIDNAKLFIETLQMQLEQPEDFGFFLSKRLENILDFVKKLLPLLHEQSFGKKKKLTRQERLDFIELFYFFLTLNIIEKVRPDTMSFTCKDALDVGGMMSAGFFAFLSLLSKSSFAKEELDILRLLIYAPVLLVRERSIDTQRLIRTISALDAFEKSLNKDFIKAISKLYDKAFFAQTSSGKGR